MEGSSTEDGNEACFATTNTTAISNYRRA